MSLKISFLDQFRSFLNTAIKIVAYLIHHLDVITGQKFKKIENFREFLSKDHPKAA